MMDKSYTSNHFGGYVGQVGTSQPRLFARKTAFGFLSMLVMIMLLGNSVAWAQGRTVTGKVTDPTGFGLPGVSVQLKGTQRGATTNGDGVYSLANVPDNATLVLSFIGYVTQEVPVGDRSTIDVKLVDDTKALQEVVVVGYGTQKIKDATGSVASLGTKDFNKGVISSPEQLLQGRVSGVQITPSSGEPGAGINVSIRGAVSLRAGNNPLFVIDGVPLDGGDTGVTTDFGGGTSPPRNPLSFLNPSDIENISVLKDASASAIYGARGANGVVLITTKKGRVGQSDLTFSASASVASAYKRYDLLNAQQFLAGVTAAGGDLSQVDKKASTDWQDQILRTGVTQNYNVGFGGGNENTRYRFSVGYQDQEGIVRNSGQKRITGRINASHDLFNHKVTLALNATTSNLQDQYVLNTTNAGAQGNLIGAAIQANPTYPVTNPDGTFYQPGGDFRNPAAILAYDRDRGETNRTLANASLTWQILEGLQFKANFGIDNATAVRRTELDSRLGGNFNLAISNNQVSVQGNGAAIINNKYRTSKLVEYTLNYNTKIAGNSLEALAGFSYQKFNNQQNTALASYFGYNLDVISYTDNLGGANGLTYKAFGATSDHSQNDLQSYFGRVNYSIQDKYLITATLRADGSSRFGINNKYGYFPSLAGAWRLSQESFVPKSIFDDLKLRVNYGVTGNQDFAGGVSKIIFTRNSDGSTVQDNNPNPNIKWEQNTTYGAGLDFTVLKGRLSGSVDYFNKSTTNLLFQVFYAQPAPVTYKWVNLPGEVINKGVEVSLNFQAVQKQKFSWEVAANATFLKPIVQGIGTSIPTGPIDGQGLSGAFGQTIRDGYAPFSFIMQTYTGLDANGLGTYADGGASKIQGDPFPRMRFGLTNNFTFGKFNASLFFNSQFGGYVYNNTANALFLKGSLKNGRNVTQDVASSSESPLNSGSVSTRFLEKSDFVRLANASVSYAFTLPQGGFAKTLSLSLSGQNLLLITSYTGLDPEVNTIKTLNNIPSLAIDYTPFPSPRTVTLGLNVGF
jgi:TonB-linked SusC/RagA family outer membrane protein